MAQPQPSAVDEAERVSADLDQLIADLRAGRPSQTRHDGHVDQMVLLGRRLITAARGPGRLVNPPLGRIGAGYMW